MKRGLLPVNSSSFSAMPVNLIPCVSDSSLYMLIVLTAPFVPLSKIWLLAVRNMSKPQSARYVANGSGAEKHGYPVYGSPARVNSMLAIDMSASLISSSMNMKYELKSYPPSAVRAFLIWLSCIMMSPRTRIVNVSGRYRGFTSRNAVFHLSGMTSFWVYAAFSADKSKTAARTRMKPFVCRRINANVKL